MYVTSMVTIQHYFTSRRALATGMAVAGSGLGTLLFGFIIPVCLKDFGWRWTLIGEALISLGFGVLFGSSYRPLDQSHEETDNEKTPLLKTNQQNQMYNGRQPPGDVNVHSRLGCCRGLYGVLKETFDLSLFRSPPYAIATFSLLLFTFSYHVPYTYIPERAKQTLHVSTTDAALLVSIIGISSVLSRVIFGWIGDTSRTGRQLITVIVLILGGLTTAGVGLWKNYSLMVLYSIFFGVFSGD